MLHNVLPCVSSAHIWVSIKCSPSQQLPPYWLLVKFRRLFLLWSFASNRRKELANAGVTAFLNLLIADAQGTKACLGWERQPDAGLHACTAVVDAWLRLLQRALHALRALRVAMPAAPEYLTARCV